MDEHSKFDRLYTPKQWGEEELIVTTEEYTGKLLWVKPDWMCSLHYHPRKSETFMCILGGVWVQIAEPATGAIVENHFLRGASRDSLDIPRGTPHRFLNDGPDTALLVEFSSPHDDEDVVRIEPSQPIPHE